MSSFDPATVRQAVAEFTPRRPQKFQELSPAREVIVELRQKRASYRAIAELLTQHCLPISKTAVAAFCHEVLGEIVRPKRRPYRKRSSAPAPNNGNGHAPLPSSEPPSADTDTTNDTSGTETLAARTRGLAYRPSPNAQPETRMNKRLDLVINGKGGVGKSFFAVNFVQFLKDKAIGHVAIDSDNENSTLKRFHPEARFLDLASRRELDSIFAALEKSNLLW